MGDDWRDDLVNPLTPWRSMAAIFLMGWAAVVLDLLDAPGRYRGPSGFNPIALLLPFAAVLGYAVLWTIWRTAERRHRRLSRERRATLTRPH